MLHIIKKISLNKKLLLLFTFCFFSCKQEEKVKSTVFKDGKKTEFYGNFYSTKYGGLNYYISDEDDREFLLNIRNIDSIVFVINKKEYTSKPLVSKAFSRERNNSDFSFLVNEREHKIKVDTINKMCTLVIFSEKTDMEEMKDKNKIKFTMIDEESK